VSLDRGKPRQELGRGWTLGGGGGQIVGRGKSHHLSWCFVPGGEKYSPSSELGTFGPGRAVLLPVEGERRRAQRCGAGRVGPRGSPRIFWGRSLLHGNPRSVPRAEHSCAPYATSAWDFVTPECWYSAGSCGEAKSTRVGLGKSCSGFGRSSGLCSCGFKLGAAPLLPPVRVRTSDLLRNHPGTV